MPSIHYIHPCGPARVRILASILSSADAASTAGRSCPLHYRYAPKSFARVAGASCDVLYVVGGLYGNTPALDHVVAAFERETGPKRLVFNGDFNWFDVDAERFEAINRRVLQYDALRGNVETELVAGVDDSGCGCAYPDWVDDRTVDGSNRIMRRLQDTAARFPALRDRLVALPMTRRVDVGGLRVAIVHGDAESLAGWGFAQEAMRAPADLARIAAWFDDADVDVFASSHTCLPMLLRLKHDERHRSSVVINNGAAGMPNFVGEAVGLCTRIATRPCVEGRRRYGTVIDGVHIDAVEISFDTARWHAEFLAQWPAGSDAHASYWDRVRHGPRYELADAVLKDARRF